VRTRLGLETCIGGDDGSHDVDEGLGFRFAIVGSRDQGGEDGAHDEENRVDDLVTMTLDLVTIILGLGTWMERMEPMT
jgi:hypothetical protein